jgi:hypothetical protein
MVTVTMGDENGVNILDPPPLQLDTDIGATVDQKVLSGPEKQSGPNSGRAQALPVPRNSASISPVYAAFLR